MIGQIRVVPRLKRPFSSEIISELEGRFLLLKIIMSYKEHPLYEEKGEKYEKQ